MPSTVMKSLFGMKWREEEKDVWAKRKITDIVAVPEWEIRRQILNVSMRVRVCVCENVDGHTGDLNKDLSPFMGERLRY